MLMTATFSSELKAVVKLNSFNLVWRNKMLLMLENKKKQDKRRSCARERELFDRVTAGRN